MRTHSYSCPECEETFKTKGMQRRHLKDKHNKTKEDQTNDATNDCQRENTQHGPEWLDCENCDFRGRSKLQIEKYMKVRHGEIPVCHFWRRGYCKNGEKFCKFSHPPPTPVCRN